MTLHQASGLQPRGRASTGRTMNGRTSDPSMTRDARIGSLAIVSGKGGVGKSTLAVNLALCLATRSHGALLIDGDVGLANADLLLGLVPSAALSDWCAGRVDFDETVTHGPRGLELIVSGSAPHVGRSLVSAASGQGACALGRHVNAHATTVFDLGAGIGASVLEVATACNLVWLIVTPEPTSLADAYTMARRLFERDPTQRIEVIVNRAADVAEAERTHRALARLVRRFLDRDLPLRGVLLEDDSMRRAVVDQEPVVLRANESRVARRIALLADSLAEESRAMATTANASLPA